MGMVTLYLFSSVAYYIKTSQMAWNASQLAGFYIITG